MSDIKPFNTMFGVKPESYISRQETNEVLNALQESPTGYIHLITGIRGSGKTVFMTSIANQLKADRQWIVIDLNPEISIYESACERLSDALKLHLTDTSVSLSAGHFSINVQSHNQSFGALENTLQKLLEKAKKREKKVLFTIDEISNSKEIKQFLHSFQLYIRNELPVYVIATGLPNNVKALKNYKTLTFLQRARKSYMTPLNIGNVRSEYKGILGISNSDALKMAKLTKGYPYAYQLLGSLVWENGKKYSDDLLDAYDADLAEYAYDKIYSEMSPMDLKFLTTIFENRITTVKELTQIMSITPKQFSMYRERLIVKGIIVSRQRGEFEVVLPRFGEYLNNRKEYETFNSIFE